MLGPCLQIFLEFNCGLFNKKIKSLRPSCQKLEFCPYKEMSVAKKDFHNCSTSSKVLYGCQLVISGEKSFLTRSGTICKIDTVRLPTITSRWKVRFRQTIFLKPFNFLKGTILRSSERGVNSILTTILLSGI